MIDGHPPVRSAEREEAEMIPPGSDVGTECFPRVFVNALRSAVVERPLKKCTRFTIKAGGRKGDQTPYVRKSWGCVIPVKTQKLYWSLVP